MQILSVDSSGAEFSVALGDGSNLVDAVIRPSLKTAEPGSGSSAQLIPTISELLARHHCRMGDLDGIVTTIGPGSFTGLRVGLMTSKTLAWAASVPLVGLTTTEVLARQADQRLAGHAPEGRIGVALNAQRGQLFAAWFERSSSGLRADGPIFLTEPAAFLRQCRRGDWLTGNGLTLCPFAQSEFPRPSLTDRADWVPQPEMMLKMGAARLRDRGGDDLWTLQPLYFRPSAAEEKRRLAASMENPPKRRGT